MSKPPPLRATWRPILAALLVPAGWPLLVAAAASAEIVPLYEIPVALEGRVGEGAPWVVLRIKSPEDAIHRSDSIHVDVDGALVVDLGASKAADDAPTDAHLAATFLVDHDEPPVQELIAGAEQIEGSSAAIQELVELTDQAIPKKTSLRDWDAASVVARRGEGDCTEHAVLLAALARAWGLPARVIVGSLLVSSGDRVEAYGHAWTEVYDGQLWQRADAAQWLDPETEASLAETADEPLPRLFYVPLAVVESEGPGYVMPLFGLTARTHPESIVVGWGAREESHEQAGPNE